jgi:phage recombination protein Bet
MTDLEIYPDTDRAPSTLFYGYTRDQVELVKRTLMPRGSTDDELRLFLSTANRMGLDPFAQQIRAIRRKEWNADTKQYEEKVSIEPGIDGFRLVAARTEKLGGKLGPFWCGPDGNWVDVWLSEDPPAAAKFGVWRDGFREPLWAVAHWREYRQTKRDGSVTKMWSDRPAGQLAKCAEALALRSAFPHELGGTYTTEEMGEVDGRVDYQTGEIVTQEVSALEAGSGLPGGRICPRGVQARTPHNHAYCETQWAQMSDPPSQPTPPGRDQGGSDPTSGTEVTGASSRTVPDQTSEAAVDDRRNTGRLKADEGSARQAATDSASDPTSPAPVRGRQEPEASTSGVGSRDAPAGSREGDPPAGSPTPDLLSPPADPIDAHEAQGTAGQGGDANAEPAWEEVRLREDESLADHEDEEIRPVFYWCQRNNVDMGLAATYLRRSHKKDFDDVKDRADLAELQGPRANLALDLLHQQFVVGRKR